MALIGSVALPVLAQPKALGDCQNISDRNARFACYDQAETAKPVIPAGATQSTIPARLTLQSETVSSTPVQGSNQSKTAAVTSSAATTSTSTATVSTVTAEAPQKPFYSKLWPFGHDDNSTAQSKQPEAKTKAKPVLTGNEVADFGRTSASVMAATSNGIKQLEDTIAKLDQVNHNTWKITLSSGQVWRQAISEQYLLKPGDKIRIRPSGWGSSYRLYSDRLGGYIQVDRVDD